MARLFFILCPAVLMGIVGLVVHPIIGLMLFIAFFGLGIDVTKVRPERGEKN